MSTEVYIIIQTISKMTVRQLRHLASAKEDANFFRGQLDEDKEEGQLPKGGKDVLNGE